MLALLLPALAFALQVNSPDTRITVEVDTDDDGAPRYSIRYRGNPVINESRLGIRFAEHHGLDNGLHIATSDRYRSADDLYYRYPPQMRVPVYTKNWHNPYPEGQLYHSGHHFKLDVF